MELFKRRGKRLGRIRPEIPPHRNPSPRILKLENYIYRVPPLKLYRDWMKEVDPKLPNGWGMMLNDQLGDCTCAAVGHGVQIVTGVTGSPITPTDTEVATMYRESGWNGSPETDNGWTIEAALNYWQSAGLAGHKIAGKVAIDPHNPDQIDFAIELFGFVDIGIMLPQSAQSQNGEWTVPASGLAGDGGPGTWGGHSVIVASRTPNVRRLITWGQDEWMITHNAWSAYVDECWAVFSEDWIKNGKSPDGVNKAALLQDWRALGGS